MHMQIFRVKKPSCKILKTKNCVPFEVQNTRSKPPFEWRFDGGAIVIPDYMLAGYPSLTSVIFYRFSYDKMGLIDLTSIYL